MRGRVIRDLGEGMIVRRSSPADTESLAAFHADVLQDPESPPYDEGIRAWVRDLMGGDHPSCTPEDFTIVEDVRRGTIASSMCLLSQTWSYSGCEFTVGRPELVSTHPDYRRRGLVRAQFKVIHRWSAARGHLMQAITGIPGFYRQFGYEMALALGGSRRGYRPQVPKLNDGDLEPFRVQEAREADLKFIAKTCEHGAARSMVARVCDEASWRYELDGRSPDNLIRSDLRIIERPDGEQVGFIAHSPSLHQGGLGIRVYELKPGISWLAVTPAVVRYLWATGEASAKQDPKQEMESFAFLLGAEHPAYQAFQDRLPHIRKPYAWYLRIPDLPGFIAHLAPALDQRVAGSILVGYEGELKVASASHGFRILFKSGCVVRVDPWRPAPGDRGDAGFPNLVFLQILFGYRSLQELKSAYADVWTAGDTARALLEALFPKLASDVMPEA